MTTEPTTDEADYWEPPSMPAYTIVANRLASLAGSTPISESLKLERVLVTALDALMRAMEFEVLQHSRA